MTATAREKLFEEVMALIQASAGPPGAAADAEMRKIMGRYRVQTKPGVEVKAGSTARDTLADRLLELWRTGVADLSGRISVTVDEFRMQLKGPNTPQAQKPARAQRPIPALLDDDDDAPPSKRGPLPTALPPLSIEKPKAPVRAGIEPVAGGPRRRGKTRAECPKCHSMGVVLARNYSGDEYFSCIYCGWQAYKPVDENDPNAPLALRLLGQVLPESADEG